MRIPSGKTDQLIYFVAVDSTDLKTRKTGLTSFTVYRSRNGAAATVYTTPTVAELSAANMPGVYSLAIDEDTTIGSSSDSEEYCVHITQASMAPVTRTIELYRRDTTSGQTITTTSGAGQCDIVRIQGSVISTPATAGILDVNVKNIDNDAASASGTVTFPNATLASTTNITAGTITTATTATNLTNLPSIPANWLTAAGINADAITAAKIADDVSTEIANKTWDTDATGHQTQGTFGQVIGDSVADADSIWGLANTNLDAAVSSRMATYTQPTGFLAATFPSGTIANTTNLTAGTVTTATTATNVTTVSSGAISEASYATTAGTFAPLQIVDRGTAQSATATTLVLRAAAAFADSELIGATIVIRTATTGAGQSRVITAYTGSTDTATVDTWTTTPTGTIVYDIFGTAKGSTSTSPVDVTRWNGTAVATPATAGIPDVNVKNIDNDAASASGTVTFPAATLASTTNITAGTIASVTNAVAITSNIKQNQALAAFEFMMTDSTLHTPVTGKTVTVTRSIDGGAFGAGALSAVTEVSNGIYKVDFAASDLNGKIIVLRATATTSDDTFERITTQV